jgi:hypothetical protein
VRFHDSHCGKSPTASTLALSLRWSYNPEISPIPTGWDVIFSSTIFGRGRSDSADLILLNNAVILYEFLVSHLRELIDTLNPGVSTSRVMCDDIFNIALEDGATVNLRARGKESLNILVATEFILVIKVNLFQMGLSQCFFSI